MVGQRGFLCVWAAFCIYTSASIRCFQLRRSQFRRLGQADMHASFRARSVNPRVGFHSTLDPRAFSLEEAKTPGGSPITAAHHSETRKRAFRRARRRAETRGGTIYRGRWHSARDLGTTFSAASSTPASTAPAVSIVRRGPARRRLRIRCYNVGGVTPEIYDHLHHWLLHKSREDVIILQEIHHGMGRSDSRWAIPGWTIVASADPQQRFSGVCIIVADRVIESARLTYNVCIPGRLLHVRCSKAGYQWVWQTAKSDQIAQSRSFFWQTLSSLVRSIPQRNLVLLGADFNSRCAPLPGLIGRGVMKGNRGADEEFLSVVRENDLVLLNTWSGASPNVCHTVYNGTVCSQIDFLAVRRPAADATARQSKPHVFDLAPWRQGPKHHAVLGSIPWCAGWKLKRPVSEQRGFSLRCMRASLKCMDDRALALRGRMLCVLRVAESSCTLAQVNHRILNHCAQLYPTRSCTRTNKPSSQQIVTDAVERMWAAQTSIRTAPPASGIRDAVCALRRAEEFKKAGRALRKASRQARRDWFEARSTEAEHAAVRHDIGEVYRIINLLAPKQRREAVRIKSAEGSLLDPKAEFEEIFEYYQSVFNRDVPFELVTQPVVQFEHSEILDSVRKLKGGRAVPPKSVPSELWSLCAEEYAAFLTPRLNLAESQESQYPPEATDCTLALLPKPHKTSRRPSDLRPLGLQDASSKVLANAIKHQLQQHTLEYLHSRPQYAYTPDRAIDEAVGRVARHCRLIRQRVQASVASVHARRAGVQQSQCIGGAMLGDRLE